MEFHRRRVRDRRITPASSNVGASLSPTVPPILYTSLVFIKVAYYLSNLRGVSHPAPACWYIIFKQPHLRYTNLGTRVGTCGYRTFWTMQKSIWKILFGKSFNFSSWISAKIITYELTIRHPNNLLIELFKYLEDGVQEPTIPNFAVHIQKLLQNVLYSSQLNSSSIINLCLKQSSSLKFN